MSGHLFNHILIWKDSHQIVVERSKRSHFTTTFVTCYLIKACYLDKGNKFALIIGDVFQ